MKNMKKWFLALALLCFVVACLIDLKHMGWWAIPPLVAGLVLLACTFISTRGSEGFRRLWSRMCSEADTTIKGFALFAPGLVFIASGFALKRYMGGLVWDICADGLIGMGGIIFALVMSCSL